MIFQGSGAGKLSRGKISIAKIWYQDLESQRSSELPLERQNTTYDVLLKKAAYQGALHTNVVPFIWED